MNAADLAAEDIERYFIKSKCPADWRRPELCRTLAEIINQLRRARAEFPALVESGPVLASNRARSAALALRSELPNLIDLSITRAERIPLMKTNINEIEEWRKTQVRQAHLYTLLAQAIDQAFPPGDPPVSVKPLVDWSLYAFMIYRVLVGHDAAGHIPWRGGPAAKFISFALTNAGFRNSRGKITPAAVERAFQKEREQRR